MSLGPPEKLKLVVKKRGFTLIEVLVAIILLGTGVASVSLALGNVARNAARIEESATLNRLAARKLDELVATGEAINGNASGTFQDEGFPDVNWSVTSEPTGVENLNTITITVSKEANSETGKQISTLVFVPPAQEEA
jgi:prepilin-type N-terminal cleavage/methylation domain-containing protein